MEAPTGAEEAMSHPTREELIEAANRLMRQATKFNAFPEKMNQAQFAFWADVYAVAQAYLLSPEVRVTELEIKNADLEVENADLKRCIDDYRR